MSGTSIEKAIHILRLWEHLEPDLLALEELIKVNPEFFACEVKGLTPLQTAILKLRELSSDYMVRTYAGLEPMDRTPLVTDAEQ